MSTKKNTTSTCEVKITKWIFFPKKKIIVQINLRSLLFCLVYLDVKKWLERMWIWIFSLIYWEEYLDVWSLTFFFLYFLSSIFGQMTNFSFFQKTHLFSKNEPATFLQKTVLLFFQQWQYNVAANRTHFFQNFRAIWIFFIKNFK